MEENAITKGAPISVVNSIIRPASSNMYSDHFKYAMKVLTEKLDFHQPEYSWEAKFGEEIFDNGDYSVHLVIAGDKEIKAFVALDFNATVDKTKAWEQLYKKVIPVMNEQSNIRKIDRANILKQIK